MQKYLKDLTNNKANASILVTLFGKSLVIFLGCVCTQGHTLVGIYIHVNLSLTLNRVYYSPQTIE